MGNCRKMLKFVCYLIIVAFVIALGQESLRCGVT